MCNNNKCCKKGYKEWKAGEKSINGVSGVRATEKEKSSEMGKMQGMKENCVNLSIFSIMKCNSISLSSSIASLRAEIVLFALFYSLHLSFSHSRARSPLSTRELFIFIGTMAMAARIFPAL